MMVRKEFGEAGGKVVVEAFMEGEEVSVLALTDGERILMLPPAQDHKAVFDNDEGPNTGGMGAYAPALAATPELLGEIRRLILEPTIRALAREGRRFRGVLYAGLMITDEGPKVVEFNCRFGDPEAQAILPLVQSDLAEILWRIAASNLGNLELEISSQWAVSVVMASGGYPGIYATGKRINGLDKITDKEVMAFHAGTSLDGRGQVVTNGGRVLSITGIGDSFAAARTRAYEAVEKISFDDAHYRKDIGAKALRYL
jgi:phosphoribosylamine--glycine ligase